MNVSIPISVSHMNASAAASYTSPLADVANSNNTLEATSGDVEKIEKFFDEPLVFVFFINPTIGLEKKRQLESQHLAQITKQVQKLTGVNNMRIKTEIDPSLVAGFTVRYGQSGSKLIDLSVKKQLEEIAAELDLGIGSGNLYSLTALHIWCFSEDKNGEAELASVGVVGSSAVGNDAVDLGAGKLGLG
ncbi:hypothetical protein ACFX11_004075 [Malus domestica]